VFFYFSFINFNSQARARVRFYNPPFLFNCKSLADHILAPGNITMYTLADDITWFSKPQLQAGSSADWPLGVVRRQRHAVRLGQRCNALGFAKSAAVSDVRLNDTDGAF